MITSSPGPQTAMRALWIECFAPLEMTTWPASVGKAVLARVERRPEPGEVRESRPAAYSASGRTGSP